MNSLFSCPHCGRELCRGEKSYRCPQGHSFDIASEGYVYLLPPNQKHAKVPGDNKQMVSARRMFLDAGWYEKFSNTLNILAETFLSAYNRPVRILDAGCGEGYYTGRLYEFLSRKGIPPETAGFDISKFAVKAAAKRYPKIEFAVASSFHIPVAAQSFDLAVNIFAPLVPTELERILRFHGIFIYAVPSESHLYGLKEILYEHPYKNEKKETEYPGFVLEERVPVRDMLRLSDPGAIQALFSMTPYYWKTPAEGSERLLHTEFLETEIGFDFLIYRRKE